MSPVCSRLSQTCSRLSPGCSRLLRGSRWLLFRGAGHLRYASWDPPLLRRIHVYRDIHAGLSNPQVVPRAWLANQMMWAELSNPKVAPRACQPIMHMLYVQKPITEVHFFSGCRLVIEDDCSLDHHVPKETILPEDRCRKLLGSCTMHGAACKLFHQSLVTLLG